MKSTIFTTHVNNIGWLEQLAKPLERSAKYFHPEIPFKIFGPEESAELLSDYPIKTLHPCSGLKAIIGKELSKQYERVVIFDADSLVVSALPEILNLTYDVAGVRAFSDHGALQNYPANHIGIKNYETLAGDTKKFLNGGFIAAQNSQFWDDWHNMNIEKVSTTFNIDEGTFNKLVLEKYTSSYQILDPVEAPFYYGTASTWGEKTAWESWKTIQLEDGRLYLKNVYGIKKQVKVMHEAGHGNPSEVPGGRFNYDKLFQPDVANFLKRIS